MKRHTWIVWCIEVGQRFKARMQIVTILAGRHAGSDTQRLCLCTTERKGSQFGGYDEPLFLIVCNMMRLAFFVNILTNISTINFCFTFGNFKKFDVITFKNNSHVKSFYLNFFFLAVKINILQVLIVNFDDAPIYIKIALASLTTSLLVVMQILSIQLMFNCFQDVSLFILLINFWFA